MAHLQHATQFPFIDELLPAEKKQCSYWLSKGRPCSRVVKLDPATAERLREELISARAPESPSSTNIRSSLIEEMIQRFSCWQHRPMLLPGTSKGREIRRRWREQLEHSAPEPSVIGRKANTSLPEATERLNIPPSIHGVTPRYNTRSTRRVDPSEVKGAAIADHAPMEEFLPMKQPGKTVAQKLSAGPVSDYARRKRHLYVFVRLSSPGYSKIGASVDIEKRLIEWSRSCAYQPVLRHHCFDVPCTLFIEGLIHCELLPHWRREIQCKHNPNCTKQHREWFHVSHETAAGVMDRWVKWMKIAEPYDASYQLKPEWRSIVQNMEGNGILVSSQRLLDAMETLHVDVATPSADERAAVPTDSSTSRSWLNKTSEVPTNTTMPLQPTTGVTDAAKLLSTVANIISSLRPEQRHQLPALLDQHTLNRTLMSVPAPVPIAAAA
ncbi:hypothetical protein H2200_007042 [Cladophialophora chaetospira]|uniref:Bacteriophage T5 Orf172 DNA-binding domain-containing protein n=1 Tax=Cladophialophora chaetospira TaxID=386627 RepID=A0AA39CH33_9EURO|nr:hypothetical protein H2200_007042 [Cladophialophora chaetospira]